MTTIQQLPEEILCKIFDELGRFDMKQCQKVCRRWYTPAHIKCLGCIDISFWGNTFEKFITSIDFDPDPRYLNAVKSITIGDLDRSQNNQIDIYKLLCRFPNIQEIRTRECLTLFTDSNIQVCKTYLSNCLKLKIFEVESSRDDAEYYDLLYKLRDIVSVIRAYNTNFANAGYGSYSSFITSFPRLTEVDKNIIGGSLGNFRNLLTVLGKLPRLETITISTKDDEQDAAQKYLDQLTKKEQDVLRDGLSKIKQLIFVSRRGMSVDSMNFARKYLTGLESVDFYTQYTENWMDSQHQLFCDTVLDLVFSAKTKGEATIKPSVDFDFLSTCFDPIMDKVFTNNTTTSVLTLHVEEHDSEFDNVSVFKTNSEREIFLWENALPSSCIKSNALLSSVDVFKIEFGQKDNYPDVINASTYILILQGMVALKELILDIPTAFDDDTDEKSFEQVYAQVTRLTLRATPRAEYQSLLDGFSTSLPSLKYLRLYYSCGIWDDNALKSQINLQKYSLVRLVVDLTPLYLKQEESMERFFVVDMGDQQLYKIPFDDPSFTKISNNDLKDLVNGQDYLTVEIIISNLQTLELVIDCETDKDRHQRNYDDDEYFSDYIPSARHHIIPISDK